MTWRASGGWTTTASGLPDGFAGLGRTYFLFSTKHRSARRNPSMSRFWRVLRQNSFKPCRRSLANAAQTIACKAPSSGRARFALPRLVAGCRLPMAAGDGRAVLCGRRDLASATPSGIRFRQVLRSAAPPLSLVALRYDGGTSTRQRQSARLTATLQTPLRPASAVAAAIWAAFARHLGDILSDDS